MSDTTGTTVPTWLAKAEAAHQNDERERIARNIEEARQLADAVNNRLTKLDIEPITEAHADAQGIIPAHLVAADPANQLHGIYAIWDEDEFEPRLLIDDYDDTRHTGELQRSAAS